MQKNNKYKFNFYYYYDIIANELFGGENIRKIINGYLKNISENKREIIKEKAILAKNKLNYIKDDIKYTILYKEKEIILIRENKEFKNILTFSKNRSILSEYIIKDNNLSIYIEVKTLELIKNDKELYIKYEIVDSNIIYEYKITLED